MEGVVGDVRARETRVAMRERRSSCQSKRIEVQELMTVASCFLNATVRKFEMEMSDLSLQLKVV